MRLINVVVVLIVEVVGKVEEFNEVKECKVDGQGDGRQVVFGMRMIICPVFMSRLIEVLLLVRI